jgi:hypothetical protein
MSDIYCDRCGELFDTNGRYNRVTVAALGDGAREIIAQVVLCPNCTGAVGDSLSLETVVHDRG